LNVCANFETVGGHAFGGETYSGGIGGCWEAGTGKLMNARFSELCTVASAAFRNVRSASISPGSIRTCVIA